MPDAIQPGLPPEPNRGPVHRPFPAPPAPITVQKQGDEFLPTMIPYRNPRALIAYYLGVFALIPCLGLLLGPAALVLGILGVRYASKNPTAKGMAHAIVGIVLGGLASLANVGGLIFFLVLGSHQFFQKFFG
jgi:hypothetical protein